MSTLAKWLLALFVMPPLLLMVALFAWFGVWDMAAVFGLAALVVLFSPELVRAIRR